MILEGEENMKPKVFSADHTFEMSKTIRGMKDQKKQGAEISERNGHPRFDRKKKTN